MIGGMADIPEAGRRAANVLLDAVVAYDDQAGDDVNGPAMNRALIAINEAGAVTAIIGEDDTTGEEYVNVDASDLLGGATVTLNWLIRGLAKATGESEEAVIFRARQFLDA